jgi:hypothetical protein
MTPVDLANFVMPDRDNTFAAFEYPETGMVEIAPGLAPNVAAIANATRDLTALNRLTHADWKEDVTFSALERVGQRVQAWVQAKEARSDFEAGRTTARATAREALATGFFSIWMAAFADIPEVRRQLIADFPNTALDCFDGNTDRVSPRPGNGLAEGGKI